MASRTFYDVQSLSNELKILVGSFAPAGSGALGNLNGYGFTVTRAGQGTYTVALTDKYFQLVTATGAIQMAAPAARYLQVGTIDTAANTVTLRAVDGAGVAQDIAADANNRVNFVLFCRNSSVR